MIESETHIVRLLSAGEMKVLKVLLSMLLPAEPASPGADDLQLAEFIDGFLHASPLEYGEYWKSGLALIDELSIKVNGSSLSAVTPSQCLAVMERLYSLEFTHDADVREFAAEVKRVAIRAYYRTEHGLHTELGVSLPPAVLSATSTELFTSEPTRDSSLEFDVIVVGSGATGGWAAKELTEAGCRVLVLESGSMLSADERIRKNRYPHQLPMRNMLDAAWQFGKRQPIQSKIWACDEYSHQFFVEDADSPYDTIPGREFTWVQGSRVGGRMNVWGRQVYRYSDLDFKAASIDGIGKDWPISYSDLEPYYDEVEEYIGVSGSIEGLPHLPDGKFLPAMSLTDGEKLLKERVERRWADRSVIIGRTATLTAPHRGRPACHHCGNCYRGCPTSSFFNSVDHTLADAYATGKLTLQADSLVTEIIVDQKTRLATGVHYVDKKTGRRRSANARSVVLAASTLASTRILMSSTSVSFPRGIGGASNVLGRYLHGHVHSITVTGTVPELQKRPGTHDEGRPNQIYIPRFVNIKRDESLSFFRGYGVEGAVKHYMVPRDAVKRRGFGKELKKSIRSDPTPARFFLTAFGTMLARHDNRVTLSDQLDHWGNPRILIDCTYGENDLRMADHMVESLSEMATTAGFEIDSINTVPGPPGQCIHEAGTARMGDDPSDSVLDSFNRTWDVRNVIVIDGSCFVSSGPQNPTLTMMALALRASRQLAADLRTLRTPADISSVERLEV